MAMAHATLDGPIGDVTGPESGRRVEGSVGR